MAALLFWGRQRSAVNLIEVGCGGVGHLLSAKYYFLAFFRRKVADCSIVRRSSCVKYGIGRREGSFGSGQRCWRQLYRG